MLWSTFPCFLCSKHLEVFQEMFKDIPNIDIMVALFGGERQMDSHPSLQMEFAFAQIDYKSPVENEEEFF